MVLMGSKAESRDGFPGEEAASPLPPARESGERHKLPSGVRGRAPTANAFRKHPSRASGGRKCREISDKPNFTLLKTSALTSNLWTSNCTAFNRPDIGSLIIGQNSLAYTLNTSMLNKKLSYRLENRASAWCSRLIIMLLQGIWLFKFIYTLRVRFAAKNT